MNKTPEQILEHLYANIKSPHAWGKAVEEIHIYANNKACECSNRPGETQNWTCNNCGKIVNDIKYFKNKSELC